MTKKAPNTTRLVFQNINSIQPQNDIKWVETINSAINHEIDMLGLVEMSANWSMRTVKARHRTSLSREARAKQISSTAITFSRNSTVSTDSYLPGGTASVTFGAWTGILQAHLHDSGNMGRWSGQQFRINQETSLFVITGYRVGKKPFNASSLNTTSSYSQQYVILRAQGIAVPDPRQKFIDDLLADIRHWKIRDSDHVVVMLDANEPLHARTDGIHKLMEQANLQDVFNAIHPDKEQDEFPSHINRSQRIDFILARPHTCRFIKAVGYAPFYSLFHSDHRAIYCDFDSSITKQQLNPLIAPPVRLIGTNSSSSEAKKYIQYVYEQFTFHRIFEKSERLLVQSESTRDQIEAFSSELNTVDELITHIMLKAERKNCTRKHRVMWSPAILHSCLVVKY